MNVAIYCDGSCPNNRRVGKDNPAGWGFVVVKRVSIFDHKAGHVIHEAWGRVVTDSLRGQYRGAEKGSNNTAELTAVLEAMLWISDRRKRESIERAAIFTDSKYAKMMISGQWKFDLPDDTENRELVKACREVFEEVDPRLRHVAGHAGNLHNERADVLARRGAESGD
jgi:ribonuclease HI